MPVIPVDLGSSSFVWNGVVYTFTPDPGSPVVVTGPDRIGAPGSVRINQSEWAIGIDHVAARLYVGCNVGRRTVWAINDVRDEVTRIRTCAGLLPDASYLSQEGTFTHKEGRRIVHEPSVQIVILAPTGYDIDVFMQEMRDLAEQLAARLDQEEVFVEIQRNGIVVKYGRMTPNEAAEIPPRRRPRPRSRRRR